MKYLKNYSAVIGFVLAFILDYNYQILEKLIKDPFWINIIRGLGAVILAKFTNTKLETKINKRLIRISKKPINKDKN